MPGTTILELQKSGMQQPFQFVIFMNRLDPKAAAARLKKLSRLRPTLAIILGSGFHHVLSELEVDKKIPYARLPGFPPVGVVGHSGQLLIGRLGGTPVMVLSGRAHFYEGHPMTVVTFAVRALAAYGIRDLLLTNAAGGVNRGFRPGDFMVLSDHINFMGTNPLRGAPQPGLPRFVDLTRAYDEGLSRLLARAGRECGVKLRAGVYLAVCGPSYETPAEIRAFARLGADAVGMSTVPEAIVARQCGLRVAAVSCITNLAAGRSRQTLSHAEVLETAERVKTWQRKCSNTLRSSMARESNRSLWPRRPLEARATRAVAPYSKFKVGAALLTRAGEIITGANVESASYGLTCCAERVALFHALTSGKRDFVAVAVVARAPGGPMPCGACRQLLAEYAPNAAVWVADSDAPGVIKEFSVKELLPAVFAEVPRRFGLRKNRRP